MAFGDQNIIEHLKHDRLVKKHYNLGDEKRVF